MKIALKDLRDKPSISIIHDYHDDIESIPDLIDIKPAHIKAESSFLDDMLTMSVEIEVDLVLACAKTLKPVDYHLKVNETIVFGEDENADFRLEDPMPFSDIIFGYILSEKPLVVYHPDAQNLAFNKTKSPHPAFADLDKFLKK